MLPGVDGMVFRRILRSTPPWKGPAHRHNELELNLVIQGSAVCIISGRRHALGPNCLLWIFPGQDHMLIRESPDFEMWVVVFRRAQVHRVAQNLKLPILAERKPVGHFCRIVEARAFSLLHLFMEEMSESPDQTAAIHLNISMDWLLVEAWRRFDSSHDIPLNADIHPAVQRLTAILRDEPGLATLEEMARRVGTSPAWLSRLFQTHMGISIPAFRNRQRLGAFLALYRKGGHYNLTQAALEAGFQSYVQFYRVFTNLMGVSPRQFAASSRTGSPTPMPRPKRAGPINPRRLPQEARRL
jgi:AraC-like DNA-binding protein